MSVYEKLRQQMPNPLPRQGDEITCLLKTNGKMMPYEVIVKKVFDSPPFTGMMEVQIKNNPQVSSYGSVFDIVANSIGDK